MLCSAMAVRTAGDLNGLREAIDPIDHQDDIGRFGGCGRATDAHRHTDVGRRKRRGIIDAVTHHDHDASLSLHADDVHLVCGAALRIDRVDADGGRNRLGHVGVIPGHHHQPPHAGFAKTGHRPSGISPEWVLEHDRSNQHPVDADEHVGQALVRCSSAHALRPCRHGAAADHVRGATDPHGPAVHQTADPFAGVLVDVLRERKLELPFPCRLDDGTCKRVSRDLVERCPEAQHLIRVAGCVGVDVDESSVPLGERPRLVEEQHVGAPEHFERGSSLDDDTTPGRPRHAANQCHGRGENQRTRRRDHQHGNGADRVARERPGKGGERDRQGHEPEGESVGDTYQRRARLLRCTDEPDDAGIRAVRCWTRSRGDETPHPR